MASQPAQALPGIESRQVATARLRCHCLIREAAEYTQDTPDTPDTQHSPERGTVILLHGNLSSSTFFEALMAKMPAAYRCIAPDMRGFGDSEGLPIDARRGVGDLTDDLRALCDALELGRVHLLGWSAGAGVVMDFVLQHPQRVQSLTLVAPVSPYGFGGTVDLKGTPLDKDFAGSGAGTVSPELVEQLSQGNESLSSPFSVRSVLREHLVKPGTVLAREDELVRAMLKQKLGGQFYPGDVLPAGDGGAPRPGHWGLINALSPAHFNVSGFARLPGGPPVLWVRGDADRVISDDSAFDLAGTPQPMVGQMRAVLEGYRASGGVFEERVLSDVGHSPHLEVEGVFLGAIAAFLERADQ